MEDLRQAAKDFMVGYDLFRRPIMKRFGLSAAQADILMFLVNNPQKNTAAQLASTLLMPKSQVSLAIAGLERRGFILRESDRGNRIIRRLKVSDSAADVVDLGLAQQRKFFACVFDGFDDAELEQLGDMFGRMRENIKKAQQSKKEA